MKEDIIIAVNGKPLEETASPTLAAINFQRQISRMAVGQKVDLTYLRVVDGAATEQTTTLTIEAMMKTIGEAPKVVARRLGFIAREKVELERLVSEGPSAAMAGLVVLTVGRDTPAMGAGLQRGDLITGANNQLIDSAVQLRSVINKAMEAGPATPVNLMINRSGQTQVITIKPSANVGQ